MCNNTLIVSLSHCAQCVIYLTSPMITLTKAYSNINFTLIVALTKVYSMNNNTLIMSLSNYAPQCVIYLIMISPMITLTKVYFIINSTLFVPLSHCAQYVIYLISPMITLTKAYSMREKKTKKVHDDINISIA